LTRAEFASTFGVHPDDRERIRQFARAHQLDVGADPSSPRLLRLSGRLEAAERAFGVRLDRIAFGGGTYRGRTGPILLPAELDGVILGVFGLDDRPQCRPHFRRRKTVRDSDLSYAPTTVATAYGFPPGTTGRGQTIGILELGGGYSSADLTQFFGGQGLAPPTITSVSVDGASNSPTGDPDGPDGEVELDIEVAGSVAPGADLAIYFAPNTDQGFLDGLSRAVHDPLRHPTILSISWGGPEASWTGQGLAAINSVLEDASTLGLTVLAAAGDGGASDGEASGRFAVDFPASSPYALGCGGTRLVLKGATISSETTWNDLAEGEGATGGGVSQVFPLPSWQSGANIPVPPRGAPGRGVPDVAGDADPRTGYSVVVDGESTVIGGTSAVAPLWAALIARLNEARGVPLGYLNPRLYALSSRGCFHDITVGNNGGYSAGPGWDPCTGLGSPDGAGLRSGLGIPSDHRPPNPPAGSSPR
jgi:kumamolisin